MANIIDSLLITLGLDSSGLSKGMSQAENRLAGGVKNITSNILAPLAGAFAFKQLISEFTGTADALGKLSRNLRADVRDIHAWGSAVESLGGDTNAFNATLNTINQRLKEAGRGFGNGAFSAFGIDTRNADGSLKNAVDIMEDLSRARERLGGERFDRRAEGFGIDAGTIALLQTGSKEVDRLVSKYKDLAYTQKDAETARDFNRTLGDLNKTFQAGSAIFMRYLIPVLTLGAGKAANLVNFLRKHESFILIFFTLLAAVIAYKLTPAILAMTKAWLANPMVRIAGIVLLLALALEDLWYFVNGNGSAIENLMKKFGASEETIESVRKTAKQLIDVLIEYGPALGIVTLGIKGVTLAMRLMGIAALSNPVLAIIGLIAMAATYLIANWDKVSAWWNGLWDDMGKVVEGWYDSLVALLGGIGDWFDGIINDIIREIKDLVKMAPEWLVPQSLLDWANTIDEAVSDAGSAVGSLTALGFSASAAEAVSQALTGGSTVNETNTEFTQSVTVYAKSDDPRGIARETGGELRALVNTANSSVTGGN